MTIHEHIKDFAGKPVIDWEPGMPVNDPSGSLYRIAVEYDDKMEWHEKFAELLKTERSSEITGIVVGNWGEVASGDSSASVVESLIAAKDWLSRLSVLFLGDILMEESEISWINQCDLSPMIEAFGALEHLCIRGGMSLTFSRPLGHSRLKTFIIQSGGLAAETARSVALAEFPALEHLELWLGEPNYGGDATAEDLAPLLSGNGFPRLQYLGLKNSKIQDDIAVAVAKSRLLGRIRTLDLSMGTLSDVGASALVAAPVKNLRLLDIHHHYVSETLVQRLKQLVLQVDASEAEDPSGQGSEDDRYIEIGE
jgi:hypothetical protein